MPIPLSFGRLVGRNVVLSLLAVAAWHGTRVATESPAPVIKIRWAAQVAPAEREALEQRFQLVRGDPVGPRSWNYDLLDSRPEAIGAIVTDRAVADTGDLDRAHLTVAVGTGRGRSRRWLWHRVGSERSAGVVADLLHTWAVLSALGLMVWDRKRSREAVGASGRAGATPRPTPARG